MLRGTAWPYVRFSKDGQFLASCGGDKLVCIYNVENGGLISKYYPHDRYVSSCAFSWSGAFFATGSNDKCVSIFNWNIEGDKTLTEALNQTYTTSFGRSNTENDHRLSVLAGREDAQLLGNMSKAHGSDINDAIFIGKSNV